MLCAVLPWVSPAAGAEDPWADSVVSYNAINPNQGFNTPEKAVGEPVGGGMLSPGNTSLHSIGTPGNAPGSYITLKFNTPVTDDPANPMGLDCIVFGNAMWIGGNPLRKMAEAGLIEISADVNGNGAADDPWYVIPGSRDLRASILPQGIANPSPPLAGNVINPNTNGQELDWGYADMSPVQRKYLDNYVRPDDPRATGLTPRSGGGDAFDIAWAVDGAGQPAHLAEFSFIRISTIVSGSMVSFGAITTELDAVADVAPEFDGDGDGILDEYETRVAGTDPARPESTVLPLETPPEEGGSPAGASLGTAADDAGNAIRLYSSGQRTGTRSYNCVVDIRRPADPGVSLSSPLLIGPLLEFVSSEPNFLTAQVQAAELTFVYAAADISGMDEAGLTPYRLEGGAYTQDGISAVARDPENNRVTFRSERSGVFALVSASGTGDTSVSAGSVTLSAAPASVPVGEPGGILTITGDPVLLSGGVPASDGTLFTISATLGAIITPDEDTASPGTQVAVSGGLLMFQVQAGAQAGTAQVLATALNESASGQVTCEFIAGPPAAPATLWLLNPSAKAPGPIVFGTDKIRDAFGNELPDGVFVTLTVDGGFPITPDANPAMPGHQIALKQGMAPFQVRADTRYREGYAVITVSLYADPEETELLATETYSFDIVIMPIRIAWPLILVLLGAFSLCRGRWFGKQQRSGG